MLANKYKMTIEENIFCAKRIFAKAYGLNSWQ